MVQLNKLHHVYTLARVAEMVGEDEAWLFDVAGEMEPEDGCIWVYGPGQESFMAFSDFGLETLSDLIKLHKADPGLINRWKSTE